MLRSRAYVNKFSVYSSAFYHRSSDVQIDKIPTRVPGIILTRVVRESSRVRSGQVRSGRVVS